MDRRNLEWTVVAGLVLPLGTVAAVRWAALIWELSSLTVLGVLFALPLMGALLLVGSGPWDAGPLGRQPDPGPERFRDRIPERHHEEFASQTLKEPVAEEPGPGRARKYGILYCVMVPAVALFVMML